jgi:CheY-like chemotaxis protein
MNSIIVIEDDPNLLRGLADTLRQQSYDVLTSANGEEGFRLVNEKQPDLVILDLLLPGVDGFDVCRRVRRHGLNTRILMLSAQSDEQSRVQGFEVGADDYVTKPFSLRELMGRVRALLRRDTFPDVFPRSGPMALAVRRTWNSDGSGEPSPNEFGEQIALLKLALEREPDDRDAFARHPFAGNNRCQFDSLTSSHEQPGDFREEAVPDTPAHGLIDERPGNLAGRRIGPYELFSLLGTGGMGDVYLATDTRLNRSVAIKFLSAHLSHDPELRRRFKREAQTVSSLNHPHICTLYDIGQHDDVDYIVMEYLEGQTLADRLRRGPLTIEQALQSGIQLADALSAAHRQGVIHGDIKPGNMMLVKTGCKLLDFGLAVSAKDERSIKGIIAGTIPYMSPEQLEGANVDSRSDIFAFGTVLYEMLVGRRAFDGSSKAKLVSAILTLTPQPVSTIRPLIPDGLDHLIHRCLARDPRGRWQSAHDLKRELQRIARKHVEASEDNAAAFICPSGCR